MRHFILLTGALLTLPLAAMAQGATQSRDGLATATQGKTSNNAMPAGSVNAETGPQIPPAYPSGSTPPNPCAAFVKTMPKPSTGPLAKPPGTVTKTIGSAGTVARPNSPGVGQASTPAQ